MSYKINMSSHKNVFTIDPPLEYHNEDLVSNMNLGKTNYMYYNATTIEPE